VAGEGSAGRSALLWAGAASGVVAVAAITAFLLVVVFGDDSFSDQLEPPAVHKAAVLRSAPDPTAAITAQLNAGEEIRIRGRNLNADWYFVESIAHPENQGWIKAAAVEPLPPAESLTVFTPPAATTTPTAGTQPPGGPTTAPVQPTFTPDLPDLRVDSVFSRDNRVTVVVSNVGVIDVTAEILVSIDGGPPQRADVKPSEPLRPDDQLEIRLDKEYVQRRAVITVAVLTDPPIEEENSANNEMETVISPDVPNDLGIALAGFTGANGVLQVTLRNNSTIPITGIATLIVRERGDLRARLGTAQTRLALDPGEELIVNFADIVELTTDGIELTTDGIELTIDDIEVRLSTNAINDANRANDVFPPEQVPQ
jgi:hypothetical protein